MDENVAYVALSTGGSSSSGTIIATVAGCDGGADGKQFDTCGVCGGDGTSCQCWSYMTTGIQSDYIHLGVVANDGSMRHNLADDGITGAIPLGFSFNFYGTAYTAAQLSANGYLHFGGAYTPYGNTWPIPSVTTPNNLVAVFVSTQETPTTI